MNDKLLTFKAVAVRYFHFLPYWEIIRIKQNEMSINFELRTRSHYLLHRQIPVNCSNSVKCIPFFRVYETSCCIYSILRFAILI
jgi:hypothetical protein